jgi:hypothetical protein
MTVQSMTTGFGAGPFEEAHRDPAQGAGPDRPHHARVAEGGGIALALQGELAFVDAARHVGRQDQLEVHFLGRWGTGQRRSRGQHEAKGKDGATGRRQERQGCLPLPENAILYRTPAGAARTKSPAGFGRGVGHRP